MLSAVIQLVVTAKFVLIWYAFAQKNSVTVSSISIKEVRNLGLLSRNFAKHPLGVLQSSFRGLSYRRLHEIPPLES